MLHWLHGKRCQIRGILSPINCFVFSRVADGKWPFPFVIFFPWSLHQRFGSFILRKLKGVWHQKTICSYSLLSNSGHAWVELNSIFQTLFDLILCSFHMSLLLFVPTKVLHTRIRVIYRGYKLMPTLVVVSIVHAIFFRNSFTFMLSR